MGYIQPCLTFSSPTATLTAPGSRAGSCPGIEEAVLRVWINRRDFDLDVSGLVDIARSIERSRHILAWLSGCAMGCSSAYAAGSYRAGQTAFSGFLPHPGIRHADQNTLVDGVDTGVGAGLGLGVAVRSINVLGCCCGAALRAALRRSSLPD